MSFRGCKHTEEWKKQRSEEMKGNKYALGNIHTEETKKKQRVTMMGRTSTKETRKKLSKAMKGNKNSLGHIHTEETKKQIRETMKNYIPTEKTKKLLRKAMKGNKNSLGHVHTEETKKQQSQSMEEHWIKLSPEEKLRRTEPGRIASQKANPSSLELIMKDALEKQHIKYEHTKGFERKYTVDFFLPNNDNLILECDGTWFHYLMDGAQERDTARDQWFIERGYKVLRLSESMIRMNAEYFLTRGIKEMTENPSIVILKYYTSVEEVTKVKFHTVVIMHLKAETNEVLDPKTPNYIWEFVSRFVRDRLKNGVHCVEVTSVNFFEVLDKWEVKPNDS